MFFPERLKRTVYVCHRSVNDDGVFIYSEPIAYRVNCQSALPNGASADLNTVGTSCFNEMQILGDPTYLKDIKAFDKVYVNVEPPEQTDALAKTADYVVSKTPVIYPNCTKIRLRSTVTEDGCG